MLFQLCIDLIKKFSLNNYLIYFSRRNPDGTTSAVVNINTNYINYLNNATQAALNNVGTIITTIYNTSKKI